MRSVRVTIRYVGLLLLSAGGCVQGLSISGEDVRQSQVVHGNVGIVGEDHELRILAGSEVPKVSIMGEDIEVYIEDGAVVDKVEIVGEDNKLRYHGRVDD